MRVKKPPTSTENKGVDGGRTANTSLSSNTTTTNNTITTTSTTSDQTSRDTLHSYFGTSTATSSSSNPAASRSQLSSPPALQSKQHQTKEGSSKMLANQRTLHSFLGIGNKKQRHDDDDDNDDEGGKKRKAGENNNHDGKVTATSKDGASATSNTKKKSSQRSVSGSTALSANSHQDHESTTQDEIKRLHSQITTLQKQLDDATSRNNSIRNNQTLISTNLQRQLKNQKIEYDKLRDECNGKMEKAMVIVEQFVRDESVRQLADLRQKLASDGARLGRLVSSRVSSNNGGSMMMGGRTQFIESWEDGHAPKRLKMKRDELRTRREELERRKNELLLEKNDNNNGGSTTTSSINDESNSTITNISGNHDDMSSDILTTMNDLDRMEAHETVRMHIDEIKRQEIELDNEEKALNIEKRGHIRALKLLSNEDSSKFRVHRKVRPVFFVLV